MNLKTACFFSIPLICGSGISHAEPIPGTDFSLHFESAHITGSGINININRVPVVNTATGETTFFDTVFKFSINESGEPVFDKLSSLTQSPPLSATNLMPGQYRDEKGFGYILSEPSVLSDGRRFYTFRGKGENRFSAPIVTGELEGHPDIGSRDIVTSLSATYVYGIIADLTTRGNLAFSMSNSFWSEGQLIGLRQSADTLSVTLFSKGSEDFNVPQEGAVLHQVEE